MAGKTQYYDISTGEPLRPALRPKSNSSPGPFRRVLPPPPKPPMTKSSQKILQLTGHDPRYDRSLPAEHSEFSHDSSSSGSVYSQSDEIATHFPGPERQISSSSAPVVGSSSPIYLKSSIYSASDKSTTPSVALSKTKLSETELPSQNLEQYRPTEPIRTFSNQPVTMGQFIHETESNSRIDVEQVLPESYSAGITEQNLAHLMPTPLAFRIKSRKAEHLAIEKTSLFANARDSMAWGIRELTTPMKQKHPAIPENTSMPPPPSTSSRKRNFSTGKHPLKSPFPFSSSRKNSDPEGPERKLSKRFSGAMTRFSGGKGSPTKKNIISNTARSPAGPDTPIPTKSGFMSILPSTDVSETVHNGNKHLQEVYLKAKRGLTIKTSGERRRDSLKKKIVVVGITDQSPDGRVAEWL